MYQTNLYRVYILYLCFVVFTNIVNAQIVIGAPSLGFSQACASSSFNTYNTTFVFSPETALETSNQFIIELSDGNGDFTNATIVATSVAGSVTVSPATLEFSLPETTSGENYRIRIKSTAPIATSSGSASFAAYYKLQDAPFTINNLVSTGAYCSGSDYLLTIDNPGNGLNDSPLAYPSLTFNWYKETSPTTSVFVSEGQTLSVSQEGTYFAETNYGTCTSNSFSNRVEISEATSGVADATIASSLGNPYCPSQGLTTLSTIGGNSYQWFKDEVLIEDATNQMYQTNESGIFSVQVDLGDCQASGSIELQSELFEVSINVLDINTIEDGESINIELETTANNPGFEWYIDEQLLTEVSGNTFEATEFGTYKIVITETIGCQGSRELVFQINEALEPFPDVENIPNLISPNGDGINDTWVIPNNYVSGTNTNVTILTPQGKVVLQTTNYLNNWPETDLNLTSINQVFYYIISTENGDTKKGSITVIK